MTINALPDITSRIVVDDSQLTKVSATSAKTGAAIAGHMQTSTTHTLRFEQSLTTLLDHFGGMPPIVNQAGRSLESMASQGVTGMGLLGGAALVAVGAVAEVVGQSIKSYTELGDKVENYKRVVGSSAEESGRMVQTFEALGVGADTATQGMFKLSKAIETSPKKLEDLGVAITHNSAGGVDLAKTLLNVADAYNATGDQGKKNLIVFDAFGKSGKDMIPILEKGSAALQQLEANARLTFSEADLERLKQTKIQAAEVKQSLDAVGQSIGQGLLPAEAALSEAYLRNENMQRRLADATKEGTVVSDIHGHAVQGLAQKINAEYDAVNKAKTAFDAQTAATDAATAANDALWASSNRLITQEEAQVTAGIALDRINITVAESAGKADKAAEAYDLAVKQFGASSDEAVLAHNQYELALLDQKAAFYGAAAAARKLQEDTDVASTGQKNAALDAQVYIDKLQAEADTLSPNNPLRINLQGTIDKLNELSALPTITKQIHIVESTTGGASGVGLTQYGAGGEAKAGVPIIVGDKGPEIYVPKTAGTILPHGQLPAPTSAEPQPITLDQKTETVLVLEGQELARFVDRRVARMLAATSNA